MTVRKIGTYTAATLALGMLPALAQAQSAGPEWDFYGHLNLGIL